MQTVASYGMRAILDKTERALRVFEVRQMFDQWLKTKGVVDPSNAAGTFRSLSGYGSGNYTRNIVESDQGVVEEIRLVEIERSESVFITEVCLYEGGGSVEVHCQLYIDGASGIIAPIRVYPRCPKILRKVISAYPDWVFGGNSLPTGNAEQVVGGAGAEDLCRRINSDERSFPIIAISVDEDECVWRELPQMMAREMIGLAHVCAVDEIASWKMTEELGRNGSCYLGAVRLYWPRIGDGARSFVWTAARLRNEYGDSDAAMKRFFSYIRSEVMSVAAATIARPRGVREVHMAAFRDRLKQMERSAIEKELDSLADENLKLSEENRKGAERIAKLEYKVLYLEERLRKNAENEHSDHSEEAEQITAPSKGEMRFYKKVDSGGGVDVMVPFKDCGHSAWQSAFSGDQAEKGIKKLEGRGDWKSIWHCGTCTGGGVWRVRW